MVTSSRRAGRVTNKTKLLIYRGSDKVDLRNAETIVWDHETSSSSETTKHQHVGAKGVESGELLEHHLQAALSSASLLHSRPITKPVSPTPHHRQPSRTEPSASSSTLNYHIPTPDATGLIETTDYAKLYQTHKYVESNGYVRFSDTVEESSGGLGGLGYCMDDEDERWLTAFNAKAEGPSGDPVQSPLRESHGQNRMPPPSAGRPSRNKGKDREKETPAPVFIFEDTFEYVMGVLEKHAEDSVPMLHTNLSLLPPFSSVEPLFATPISASFLPSNEVPRGLPELKSLSRMARSIYPHWKVRREKRKGRTIMPILNYDETNDGDPYVCFRRRDIRATRKTRRTDNFSVERMQKIQTELRSAHNLSLMVLRREQEKSALYKAERELWEAKWKLFETKRRWPSLGMTREEEEVITGRTTGVQAATVNTNLLGRHHLQQSVPRKRLPERERDEREKRERAMEATKLAEKGLTSTGRSSAPEVLRERMAVLRQRLEEELAKKKAADLQWDDATDSSYQPLPLSQAAHSFRPITALDPRYSFMRNDDEDEDDKLLCPPSFRLRRGRGGILRLDRRNPVLGRRRCAASSAGDDASDLLFPDTISSRPSSRRPKSIEEVEEEEEDTDEFSAKRRRLNEVWRYDVDHGGALGVGMGVAGNGDWVLIDDLDPKYIRNRITLLQEEDIEKLRPDPSPLAQALAALDGPIEMPPVPVFVRPQLVPPNPQLVAAHLQQQQLLQQQQMEQFQRFQLMQQQQAIAQQQAMAAQAQQVQQRVPFGDGSPAVNGGQQMLPPNGVPNQPQNGRPPVVKRPSSQNGASMPPPSQPRQSLSPSNSMHPNQQLPLNGQSPQMVNGMMLPNGKNGFPQPGQSLDPAMQQRILQARAVALAQQQAAVQQLPNGMGEQMNGDQTNGGMTAEQLELARLSQQAGFGTNIQAFVEARNKARIMNMAKMAQQQQQLQLQGQANGNVSNGNGTPQPGYGSPGVSNGQLQLKFPPHAAARLGASESQQRM